MAWFRCDNSGADVRMVTATASDVRLGKKFVDSNGALVTGTIPSLSAQTITPTASQQTILAGSYIEGTQTILGSANLIASNIKSGVTIWGISGTMLDYYSGRTQHPNW